MRTTNEKIARILRQHPEGGTKFFDALDLMIGADRDILGDYIDFVKKYVSPSQAVGCVVTGSFGRVLASVYPTFLQETFGQTIIVNGGIRSGAPVELPVFNVPLKRYVLLDDSYYSGKTCKSIEKALQEINPTTCIDRVFVVYDGSHEYEDGIYAMYRYYQKEENNS